VDLMSSDDEEEEIGQEDNHGVIQVVDLSDDSPRPTRKRLSASTTSPQPAANQETLRRTSGTRHTQQSSELAQSRRQSLSSQDDPAPVRRPSTSSAARPSEQDRTVARPQSPSDQGSTTRRRQSAASTQSAANSRPSSSHAAAAADRRQTNPLFIDLSTDSDISEDENDTPAQNPLASAAALAKPSSPEPPKKDTTDNVAGSSNNNNKEGPVRKPVKKFYYPEEEESENADDDQGDSREEDNVKPPSSKGPRRPPAILDDSTSASSNSPGKKKDTAKKSTGKFYKSSEEEEDSEDDSSVEIIYTKYTSSTDEELDDDDDDDGAPRRKKRLTYKSVQSRLRANSPSKVDNGSSSDSDSEEEDGLSEKENQNRGGKDHDKLISPAKTRIHISMPTRKKQTARKTTNASVHRPSGSSASLSSSSSSSSAPTSDHLVKEPFVSPRKKIPPKTKLVLRLPSKNSEAKEQIVDDKESGASEADLVEAAFEIFVQEAGNGAPQLSLKSRWRKMDAREKDIYVKRAELRSQGPATATTAAAAPQGTYWNASMNAWLPRKGVPISSGVNTFQSQQSLNGASHSSQPMQPRQEQQQQQGLQASANSRLQQMPGQVGRQKHVEASVSKSKKRSKPRKTDDDDDYEFAAGEGGDDDDKFDGSELSSAVSSLQNAVTPVQGKRRRTAPVLYRDEFCDFADDIASPHAKAGAATTACESEMPKVPHLTSLVVDPKTNTPVEWFTCCNNTAGTVEIHFRGNFCQSVFLPFAISSRTAFSEILYDFRVHVRASNIPNSGYGAFFTFLGARRLKAGSRGKKLENAHIERPIEDFDFLEATGEDGFGIQVRLFGLNSCSEMGRKSKRFGPGGVYDESDYEPFPGHTFSSHTEGNGLIRK
jgi:hypothetical protein